MTRQAETARCDVPPGAQAGGGRMAAEERRLQIVGVAVRLFSERGFRGTTTKEIAQAAGVSEAIIFRHFATKEDLYTAIIDYKSCAGLGASRAAAGSGQPAIVETVRACVADAMGQKDDRGVFQNIALSMMEQHQRDPELLRLLMYSALEGHQLSQIFWDRNVRVLYEFVGGYVRTRQRDGAFRDVDPLVVVRAFTGAIIHHSLNNILWDRDPARRILDIPNEEAARAFTEILLRGIAAPAEGGARRVERGRRAASANKGGAAGNRNKKK